jgi:fido (protein-threonine AMPylation protein)
VANDPYVYPGLNVLRNRSGVRDARITVARSIEVAERPILGTYDSRHLQTVHHHIFGDVYPWAGEIRTVAIAKGDLFVLPEHIEPYLSDVLERAFDEIQQLLTEESHRGWRLQHVAQPAKEERRTHPVPRQPRRP